MIPQGNRHLAQSRTIGAGSTVALNVGNEPVIIDPRSKPRYTLAELLSRCRPADLVPRRADKPWLRGGPAGRELL